MNINYKMACRLFSGIICLPFISCAVFASTLTVTDQTQPTYKYRGSQLKQTFAQATPSSKELMTELSAGVSQGVDTNPLLDSTHKADNYNQETLDMRFEYNLPDNKLGELNSRFGMDLMNINYYRINDVDVFDGTADINIDQKLSDDFTLSAGYMFETLWYPHDTTGTYFGNEINAGFKQELTESVYQKVVYRLQLRNYLDNKVMLGNGTDSSDLRFDVRNIFRHEVGVYLNKKNKVRVINEFMVNNSNYQFVDFYDYDVYRTGCSLMSMFTKKFYGVAGFYYQRRWYISRTVSVGDYDQRDNLFTVTASLSYDISKNLSIFGNYTHMENHTNEPLEQYVDTLFYGGFNYNF